jgi:acyl transferase domain-containing protein/acyl-CoA synthetase (AMP-forming)/AMP-acid ligase II/acyl carrier protein
VGSPQFDAPGPRGGNGTLVDLLEARAATPLGSYEFLRDGQGSRLQLGLPELAGKARAIAAVLQECCAEGSRALLLYPPGLDFLPALFGCLYAGMVAIPAPPPDHVRLKHSLPRLLAILEDAEPAVILTTRDLFHSLFGRLDGLAAELQWLTTDDPSIGSASRWNDVSLSPGSLAYLQYTSGSTARPRGVMLTHGQLLHNLHHLRCGFAYTPDSRSVTWMPHFHDYGLVEGLLQPLYSNIPCQILSPITILRRPLRWLQAMDQHGATHTHGANFAYDLCVQRTTPEERRTLNLSRWQVAGNGSELIRTETLRRFSEAFTPSGFRATSFYPAYGLAEATLFVTARPHDRMIEHCVLETETLGRHEVVPATAASRDVRVVTSCGAPQPGTDLRIVDPDTRLPCAAGRVGEIWVADLSIAAGYWRKPEDTEDTFHARLADDPLAGPYLRTGDLGFVRDGQLYVTGRRKDVIIVGGANIYAQDVEWTVEQSCAEVRRHHCVAFGVTQDDKEQIVVLVEPERPLQRTDELFRRIRRIVAEQHGARVAAVALVRRGGILKTSSGKLQRQACRAAFLAKQLETLAAWSGRADRVPATDPPQRTAAELTGWLCRFVANMVGSEAGAIDPTVPFAEHGLDSRHGLALVAELEAWLGDIALEPGILWQYPSIVALASHLAGLGHAAKPPEPRRAPGHATDAAAGPVAIVGLACRFPGAPDPAAFWSLLREGRSAVGHSPRLLGVEAGFLTDVEAFDAGFFGLSGGEARAMDPQHRLLLEVAWEALEHAGIAPPRLAGRKVGVWIGISTDDHAYRQFAQPDAARLTTAHSGPGIARCMAANRISYLLDLRGPSMAIDTACSSSLVAVHQACQSLRSGETELALAGGVNLLLTPHLHLALRRAGMLSPDQRCKTFDASADGYVRGEGGGVIVLKRLADARRDGDDVLAVIRGSAVNQDGRSNGLTAPNPAAQETVIRDALAEGGVDPASVDYVEAHGTGTRLGDPIEFGALRTVLGQGRKSRERCLVGSVKANIGHLEAAAGIAGLLKVVLSLRHGEVAPQLNLRQVNPLLRLGGPFEVPTAATRLPALSGRERHIAAVSSFGFGGTNAHVVVEAVPQLPFAPPRTKTARPLQCFALSGRDPEALRLLAGDYAAYIAARPGLVLADLCRTVSTGRAHHRERLALPATDTGALAEGLRHFAAGRHAPGLVAGCAPVQPPPVVFLFTGQGSQYPEMGRRLYTTEPLFRSILDESSAILLGRMDRPLLSVLFDDAPTAIDRTAYTQPALFAIEYALARLWQHWGIQPAAVLGHSVGDYVAACLAGVFDLPAALQLIAARGRLIGQLPQTGAMLAVATGEAELRDATRGLEAVVDVAAVNGPANTVLSGERRALETVAKRLTAQGRPCRFLVVSHAFHSPLLDPVLDDFHALASQHRFAAPQLTWVGNGDGAVVETAPGAGYWTRHMRHTVRFADAVRTVVETLPSGAETLFLEIGPNPVLGPLALQNLDGGRGRWLPSLRRGRDDWDTLLGTLAQLYAAGVTPDWDRFAGDAPGRRLSGLPTYRFQRRAYGSPASSAVAMAPERGEVVAPAGASSGAEPTTIVRLLDQGDAAALALRLAPDLPAQQRADLEAWMRTLVSQHHQESRPTEPLYRLDWQEASAHVAMLRPAGRPGRWLILADRGGCGDRLRDALQSAGAQAVLHPAEPGTAGALEGLLRASLPLTGVVYLGALDAPVPDAQPAAVLLRSQALGCEAVVRIVQALVRCSGPAAPRFWTVTQGASAAGGTGTRQQTDQATLWGIGRVIGLEHPQIHGGQIDLSPGLPISDQAGDLAGALLAPAGEDQIALRAGRRLVPRLRSIEARSGSAAPVRLRADATYVVTGGLGALGLRVARWMLERGAGHLVLVGRRAPSETVRRQLAEIEQPGAALHVVQADIAQEKAMGVLFARLQQEMPSVRGVVHAAGVIDDALLMQQDPQRLRGVIAPKLVGGWILHQLTLELPLDFFVLFSSATSLLGWQGQSAYAAANAGLDALAHHRRRLGLAGLSINWGPWQRIGAAAGLNQRLTARWQRRGLASIDPEQGLRALEMAMGQNEPQVAVLPMDWDRFVRTAPPGACDSMLSTLVASQPDAGTPASRGALRNELAQATPVEWRGIVSLRVRAEIAAILDITSDQVADEGRGLFDMGFDSLMALELKNRLEIAAARALPATLAFDCPSIAALVDYLLDLVTPAWPDRDAATMPVADDQSDSQVSEAMVAEVVGLSERDLELLVDAEFQRSLQ